MKDLLTTAEAATLLNVSARRVVQFCTEGRFGSKCGRDWLITKKEVERFSKLDRPSHRPMSE